MTSRSASFCRLLAIVNLALSVRLRAEVLSVSIPRPPAPETGYFKLGTITNPAGQEISVNSRSLLLNGQPWFPVMGEIHYARVPQAEWRDELLKMKAGGIDIVATYVFWIHHEEVEGQWDWRGRRDLHQFIETCRALELKVIVRCGPWCHGEVRNGGFPDWVMAHQDWKLCSTDTNFLGAVKRLYAQISQQLHGELWKDGGPVIGIQVDNEFGGSPKYLLALKQIAVEAGIDVPFYIKTGWPAMKTPVPLGELIPLFGAYADGFWDRTLRPMNGNSWENFTFRHTRTDTGVGNDTLGNRQARDTAGTEKYPYLTCEIGGGMPASYHRRMNYDPRDVEAVALCQLGSGSSLMGYYMYHGGQNPDGKLTTLQESQATGYPNDLPVKSYDFNAPIGEFGQINPQYYWLRRLHLFLHTFGNALAPMPTTFPEMHPTNKNNLATLRWAVRSDGHSGYVFVNNYERLRPLPAKPEVQFKLNLPGGELVFPPKPVTIPTDAFFFWPFNLYVSGTRLIYATAQPIGKTEIGDVQIYYFAETPGIKADFAFDPAGLLGEAKGNSQGPQAVFENVRPSREPAFTVTNKLGEPIQIVLLSDADSLALRKTADGKIFFDPPARFKSVAPKTELIMSAGPAREIPLNSKTHLALAPTDADFTNAAVWKIRLPARLDMATDPLLRIRYLGDVARLTLNGKLIADNFYSGREFDLGLKRYAPEILAGDLRLEILPLRKDAPVFFEPKDKPDFDTNETLLKLQSANILQRSGVETAK